MTRLQRLLFVSPVGIALRVFFILFAVLPVTGAVVTYGASRKIPDTEGDSRDFYIRLFSFGLITQFIWAVFLVAFLLPSWVIV